MKAGKVEKGVAVPLLRKGRYTEPLKKLKVGESILFTFEPGEKLSKALSNLRACLSYLKKKTKLGFTCRKVKDGARVWRIK